MEVGVGIRVKAGCQMMFVWMSDKCENVALIDVMTWGLRFVARPK